MKTKILILLVILCSFSCSEEDPMQAGCLTGILGGDRVFIRCMTQGEFSNLTPESLSWGLYKDCKWEQCSNCK